MLSSNQDNPFPDRVFSQDHLVERHRLNSALAAAGIGSWEFDVSENVFWICDRFKTHFNFSGEGTITLDRLLDLVLSADRPKLNQVFQNAMASGENCEFETEIRISGDTQSTLRWIEWKGYITFNTWCEPIHVSGIVRNITELVLERQKSERRNRELKSIMDHTSDMVTRWNTGLELIFANALFVNNTGIALSELLNKPAREMGQSSDKARLFVENLLVVIDSGLPRYYYSRFLTPKGEIVLYSHLVPEFSLEGQLESVLCICRDVSQLKVGDATFQTMIEQAPMAIGLLSGRDMIIDVGNERIFEVWGKPASVTGFPLMEALPELEGQGFLELLQAVFDTGVPYFGNEVMVKLVREGQIQDVYFDFVYTPLRDADQIITGVMILATEVTTLAIAKQKAYEAESTLREAVELAELGTWQSDFLTGLVDCSDRMKEWLGISQQGLVSQEMLYEAIRPFDHYQLKAALAEAISGGGNGLYDVEFLVQPTEYIKEKILRARGKIFYDDKGIAVKMSGTIHDVTRQRRIELGLQLQVHDRTAALVLANEELAALNEEYVSTNEELKRTNRLLNISNQSLQQFAYVASHDLQEPLRKIKAFGDILQNRYAQQLGDGSNYVVRMQAAAGRMSTLIEDLLSFSFVSSTEIRFESVALREVVKNVLSDLELSIEKSHAVIQVDELPVIKGDRLQLEQLLQNLLSNALKFQRPDTTPVIQIDWKIVRSSSLPEDVVPGRHSSAYDRITITDNGIGFEKQYTQRIFQVFQRLHGKSEFEGTGIGLAICEQVVNNHGGLITATSQLGNGSTFSVYFPIVG